MAENDPPPPRGKPLTAKPQKPKCIQFPRSNGANDVCFSALYFYGEASYLCRVEEALALSVFDASPVRYFDFD
jgi:hypothetical protein